MTVDKFATRQDSRGGTGGDSHCGTAVAAAVICPIGFVCDHVEVLYDLDVEAAHVCRDVGLPMARAATVNDDPLFLEMMADEVVKTWDRYRTGRPLVLSGASHPCPTRPRG